LDEVADEKGGDVCQFKVGCGGEGDLRSVFRKKERREKKKGGFRRNPEGRTKKTTKKKGIERLFLTFSQRELVRKRGGKTRQKKKEGRPGHFATRTWLSLWRGGGGER